MRVLWKVCDGCVCDWFVNITVILSPGAVERSDSLMEGRVERGSSSVWSASAQCMVMLSALAVLISAAWLSSSAPDPGFLRCQECFFRATPPPSLSESGLEQRCHQHLTGRPFASMYDPHCKCRVFTALHLSESNGWGREEQGTEASDEIGEDSPVSAPVLYNADETLAPSHCPLRTWEVLTASLIRRSAIPLCSNVGGEIYVQSGVTGSADCEGKLLWSAVCCAAADGDRNFSVGLVRDETVRVVSIQAVEELIGVTELFSGGCVEHQREEKLMLLFKDQLSSIQSLNADEEPASEEDLPSDSGNEGVASQHSSEDFVESVMDVQERDEMEIESSDCGSVLLSCLSCTVSLLYSPFSPVVNKITSIPSQLLYVLQEDMAVLSSVPCDSLTLLSSIGDGVSSGASYTLCMVGSAGEAAFCSLYCCLCTLAGGLLAVCQEGLAGSGTLASEVLGMVTGAMDSGFCVGKVLVGSVGQRLLDYLCAVGGEMGLQVSAVGGGIGKLTWRSGNGVGHVFNTLMSLTSAVIENVALNLRESFEGHGGTSAEVAGGSM